MWKSSLTLVDMSTMAIHAHCYCLNMILQVTTMLFDTIPQLLWKGCH